IQAYPDCSLTLEDIFSSPTKEEANDSPTHKGKVPSRVALSTQMTHHTSQES
ncbi:hypothetical protein ACLOJK_038420, partial [Asimina triloba]